MNVLIAPDKFKGSLSAWQVSKAIARGIHNVDSQVKIKIQPMADGGDGSLAVLERSLELHPVSLVVRDPLSREHEVNYLVSKTAAYIELATSSGIALLKKSERNPLYTTSYGFGECIAHAIESGKRTIYLFLGGSSTNDAGMGVLQALGYRFLDSLGQELNGVGEHLEKVAHIDTSDAVTHDHINFEILCDVDNPLNGPKGAAHVFARQKGATDKEIERLDRGLESFAEVVNTQLGLDISNLKGGGAAGGIAAGLSALLNARCVSGAQTISRLVNFEQQAEEADIIITGEGRFDNQSLDGKVISHLLDIASQLDKPIYAFVGSSDLTEERWRLAGVSGVYALLDMKGISLADAIRDGEQLLASLAAEFWRVVSP